MAMTTPIKPASERSEDERIHQDMQAVTARLKRIVRPEAVNHWLSAPNERLGEQAPLEAVRLGQTSQVFELIAALEEGLYV